MLKVLKYDWRCGWQNVRTTLIIAVILSVFAGIMLGVVNAQPVFDNYSFAYSIEEVDSIADKIMVGSYIVWFAVMVALLVQTIEAICRNFVGRMFGPEAYITHTLPVSEWELLLGKSVGTWVFGVFMWFFALLCLALTLFTGVISTGSIMDFIRGVVDAMPKLGAYHFKQLFRGAGYVLYGIAAFLAWSYLIIVQFQFICIAARQFGRFHVAGGIIVSIVLLNIETRVNSALSMGFVVMLVFSAACFFGSGWLLKHRLNINN